MRSGGREAKEETVRLSSQRESGGREQVSVKKRIKRMEENLGSCVLSAAAMSTTGMARISATVTATATA